MWRTWLILLSVVVLGGCSASADAIGRVGRDAKEFRGTATGYMDRTGTIDMSNPDGTKCVGHFRYIGTKTGIGVLSCNDGRAAQVQFIAIGMTSGYGYGITNTGEPVRFTFGLSETAAAPYLTTSASSASADPRSGAVVSGTGFYINPQGHILTNEHVAGNCSSLTIQLPDGTTSTGQLIAADEPNDLAVVLSQARPKTIALFSANSRYRPGDPVVTFGFPYAGRLADTGNLTTGTVSALAGLKNDSRALQISAPVQPGNSGGPLLDNNGHVIGVVASGMRAVRIAQGDIPQNVNFAIKDTVAKAFLQSHHVSYSDGKDTITLSAADIGEIARNYAVRIRCVLK